MNKNTMYEIRQWCKLVASVAGTIVSVDIAVNNGQLTRDCINGIKTAPAKIKQGFTKLFKKEERKVEAEA